MTFLQGYALGIISVLVLSLILLAFLYWVAPIDNEGRHG